MSAVRLYRVAAILLFLFAVLHTYGFLKFRPPSREGQAVWDAMRDVHFQAQGSSFSYGGFYVGFGLSLTAYLLFSAILSWHLSGLSVHLPQAVNPLGWWFMVLQLASLVLSWIYFSAAPAIFSALVAACLGGAAWKARIAASQVAGRHLRYAPA